MINEPVGDLLQGLGDAASASPGSAAATGFPTDNLAGLALITGMDKIIDADTQSLTGLVNAAVPSVGDSINVSYDDLPLVRSVTTFQSGMEQAINHIASMVQDPGNSTLAAQLADNSTLNFYLHGLYNNQVNAAYAMNNLIVTGIGADQDNAAATDNAVIVNDDQNAYNYAQDAINQIDNIQVLDAEGLGWMVGS